MNINVSKASELYALREARGYDAVNINFSESEFAGNLAIYAVKFAMWALKAGGTLTLTAPSTLDSMTLKRRRLPFQLLTQLVARSTQEIGDLTEVSLADRTIRVKRKATELEGIWSAGVIFSGNEAELPMLRRCLHSLLKQPELQSKDRIVVCGPESARSLVIDTYNVAYLACETPTAAGRFLIGIKKNALISHLDTQKILICHSRVVLGDKALSAMPPEFDLITPRISINGRKKDLPYLDLGFLKLATAAMAGVGEQPPIFYPRDDWLRYVKKHYPYVDGGAFCVRGDLAKRLALHPSIAWGEGEDVEWCIRLLIDGNVVELANSPAACATSLSCKLPRYERFGHLISYRFVSRFIRALRSFLS